MVQFPGKMTNATSILEIFNKIQESSICRYTLFITNFNFLSNVHKKMSYSSICLYAILRGTIH